jgi:Fur family transcriptional regulator, peroxide stress response regulator
MVSTIHNHSSNFIATCRAAGLKVTQQRIEICSELARSKDHPSAELLHRRLRKRLPSISLDTVYRTLETFLEHGLIQKVETTESLARYEVAHLRHHHVICRRCRGIVDFLWPAIDESRLPKDVTGWGRVESRNVVVYGICKACMRSR